MDLSLNDLRIISIALANIHRSVAVEPNAMAEFVELRDRMIGAHSALAASLQATANVVESADIAAAATDIDAAEA